MSATTMTGKSPAIYIVTNKRHGTLYVGVTSNLINRIHDHRTGASRGFASQHGCKVLVYFELHADMPTAIAREKQIKPESRAGKIALKESRNGAWRDLHAEIMTG
jgi:putative endonuclease